MAHVERLLAELGGAIDAGSMGRSSGEAFTTADVTRALADMCARDEGGRRPRACTSCSGWVEPTR